MKKVLLIIAMTLGVLTSAHADPKVNEAIQAYEKGEFAKALNDFIILAEKGNPIAQNNLAVMYANGEIVKQDFRQAAKWYTLAAEQGLTIAQYNLASLYEEGKGVEQDYHAAAVWHQMAGNDGDPMSQYRMGVILFERLTGIENDIDALFWLMLAERKITDQTVLKDIKQYKSKLTKRMTKKQIVEAEFLVGAWKPQH